MFGEKNAFMERGVSQAFWWGSNVGFRNRLVKRLAQCFKGLGNLKAERILFGVLKIQRARQADRLLWARPAPLQGFWVSSPALCSAVPSTKDGESSEWFQGALGFPGEERVSPESVYTPERPFVVVRLRQIPS